MISLAAHRAVSSSPHNDGIDWAGKLAKPTAKQILNERLALGGLSMTAFEDTRARPRRATPMLGDVDADWSLSRTLV
jgi:hypothetical protein